MIKKVISPRVINKIKKIINDYCIHKCDAKCCKKGKLLLQSTDEVKIIFPSIEIKKLLANKIIQMTKFNNYTLDYNSIGGNCPHLTSNNLCNIYQLRPVICKDFPIIFKKNTIYYSTFCPAIKNEIIQKQLSILKKQGATLYNML